MALNTAEELAPCSAGGKKTTLVCGAFERLFNVSRYLICIAEGVLKISAASLINFAESTSAFAEIIFDSPVRLACAAAESDS